MELIILGHILGNFYFQTDNIAIKKKISFKYMLLHCFLYSAIMYIMVNSLVENFYISIEIVIIIGATHMLIDILKNKISKKTPKYEVTIFIVDQLVHVCILIEMCFLYKNYIKDDILQNSFMSCTIYKIVIILIAILICWKPASIFVALIFKEIPITIEQADSQGTFSSLAEHETVKIGALIGILEREIILLLGLLGQYGAIGFVLTAKSLARYKQLENKAFAEKYLVGTLLSAFIAFVCVAMCSAIGI